MKIKIDIVLEVEVPAGQEEKVRGWYEQEEATERVMNKLKNQAIEQFKANGINDVVTVSSKIVEDSTDSGEVNKRYYFMKLRQWRDDVLVLEGNVVMDTHPVEWVRSINKMFENEGSRENYILDFYQRIGKEEYDAWENSFDGKEDEN